MRNCGFSGKKTGIYGSCQYGDGIIQFRNGEFDSGVFGIFSQDGFLGILWDSSDAKNELSCGVSLIGQRRNGRVRGGRYWQRNGREEQRGGNDKKREGRTRGE